MSNFLVKISRSFLLVLCKVQSADICQPQNIKACFPTLRKLDSAVSSYKISCWNRKVPPRKWWNIKGEYSACTREKISVVCWSSAWQWMLLLTHNSIKSWCEKIHKRKCSRIKEGRITTCEKSSAVQMIDMQLRQRAMFCLTHRVIGNVTLKHA